MEQATQLQILIAPHAVLSTRCEDITLPSKEVISEMLSLMQKAKGVGLAAPQVGISSRFFVLDNKICEDYFIHDPKILAESKEKEIVQEGCLSVHKMQLPVARPACIRVSYQNDTGHVERTLSGAEARVFQHEYDHLEGILFVQRFPDLWLPPRLPTWEVIDGLS